jgi:hypothetical protein
MAALDFLVLVGRFVKPRLEITSSLLPPLAFFRLGVSMNKDYPAYRLDLCCGSQLLHVVTKGEHPSCVTSRCQSCYLAKVGSRTTEEPSWLETRSDCCALHEQTLAFL